MPRRVPRPGWALNVLRATDHPFPTPFFRVKRGAQTVSDNKNTARKHRVGAWQGRYATKNARRAA